MDNHRIIPFYMAYPMPVLYKQENNSVRDLEYLFQLYPAEVRRYQRKVEEELNRIDYFGSMIYDEYPDKWTLYQLAENILQKIQQAERSENNIIPSEKWEWLGYVIHLLLYNEIYRRRHSSQSGTITF